MRRLLPLCLALLAGCSQSLAGFGALDDGGTGLPPNREVRDDAGVTDAGSPPGGTDAGGPGGGNDAGPGPDGGPGGAACVTWEDCPPYLGDPNSGFACVDAQCVCDPEGTIGQGCAASGGFWDPGACYCTFLTDEQPSPCSVWQDCPPHYESTQSGYECVSQQCTCDPTGTYQANCGTQGGYWVPEECYCAFTDVAPPGQAPEPDCWWHLEEPPCDPDRWVDTSRYETECRYDHNDEYVCEQVWVESGYWEDGPCPSPYWEQRCYG